MRPPKFNPRQIGKFVVLSVVGLVVLYVISMLFIAEPTTSDGARETKSSEQESQVNGSDQMAIAAAKLVYDHAKASGLDLTTGPCLSESAETGWVVDIAHLPREPIDDLPENQCAAYISGKIKHFVELDADGAVIRLK